MTTTNITDLLEYFGRDASRPYLLHPLSFCTSVFLCRNTKNNRGSRAAAPIDIEGKFYSSQRLG